MQVVCCYCHTTIRALETSCSSGDLVSHGICDACLPALVKDLGQTMDAFLDDLGTPIIVVGGQGRMVTANAAARNLMAFPLDAQIGSLPGEVIGCAHALEEGGCGKTVHCESCTIRMSVTFTMKTGLPCTRVPAFADIGMINANERVRYLVSTEKRNDLVLLRIETVAEDPLEAAASAPAPLPSRMS